MITFFCPSCWKEIKKDDSKCPFCRADITEHEKKGFEEKLINALNHPERETVQRAVWILGSIKSAKAVQPLIQLFERTDNPFLKVTILYALSDFAMPEAVDFIVKSMDSEMSMVKKTAAKIMEGRLNL
jgi:predicted amidophosphoribosyltransferase